MAARFWAFAFTQLPRGTDNLGSNPETRHSSRQVASHGTWHFENSIQPKAESTRTPKLQCNPKAETGAACMDPPARDHHRPELAEPRVMEPYTCIGPAWTCINPGLREVGGLSYPHQSTADVDFQVSYALISVGIGITGIFLASPLVLV